MTDSANAEGSQQKTVLVAEDETTIRLMIADLLEEEGYGVIQASDGEQAWRMFEEHRDDIQLVIADVLMPEMNGIELRRKIHDLSPATRVLFISGYIREDTGHLVGLQKTEELLTKPFNVETLVTKVREMSD